MSFARAEDDVLDLPIASSIRVNYTINKDEILYFVKLGKADEQVFPTSRKGMSDEEAKALADVDVEALQAAFVEQLKERDVAIDKLEGTRKYKVMKFIVDAVVTSTVEAWKDYKKNTMQSNGYREFGLSFVFRGELQMGAGKLNVMKAISRGFDIGIDFKSKEFVFRRVVRQEHMGDGLALTTDVKAEARIYRADLADKEHLSAEGEMHGKTWYPPAGPAVTLSGENFDGYNSVGAAIAFNPFDYIVPLWWANTVNEFDAKYKVKRVPLSPVHYAKLLAVSVKDIFRRKIEASPGPSAELCRDVFSRI